MTDRAPTHPPFRLPRSAWIMAAVLFVASLWLNTRHNNFPYSYHPDETGKTGQIIGGMRNYHHPLLMLSVTDIASRVSMLPRERQTVVQIGRWVSAVFAAGAVVALALIAFQRYGLLAGWGAGIAVALQVDLFETAHYMKEDPTMLFGLAVSLLAAQIWWQTPSRRTLRFLGIACGVATGGKYLGIIALAFALPLVIWHRASDALMDRRARLKLFAIAFGLAFLVCNLPLFATKLSSPFRSIRNEMKKVAEGDDDTPRKVPHGEYLETLRRDMPRPVLILGGAYALIVFATARRRTAPEWATLLFPLGYLAVISCSSKTADRYLLPVNVLLPFLAVLGAAEIARVFNSPKLHARQILVRLILVSLIGWQVLAQLPSFRRSFEGFTHDDPAAVAEWVKAHLPPDAVIVEDHRVSLSPTKTEKRKKPSADARVPQTVFSPSDASDLGTLDELRAMGVTHVAVCKPSYSNLFKTETKPREGANSGQPKGFYARVVAEGELLKEWPPGTISYLQPGIKLFRVAPAQN